MKILILGADGRTGREVVSQALKAHQITAFMRDQSSVLDAKSSAAKIIVGDATNYQDIREATPGHDVIISVIGHVKNSKSNMQTTAMNNLIRALKENQQNDTKIISLTGSGVRVPGDTPSIIDRLMNKAIKIIDKDRIVDGIKHYQALEKSQLNWTVLRVLKLTSSDKLNPYKLTLTGPAKTFISRKSVASALLEIASTDNWSNTAPIVSSK